MKELENFRKFLTEETTPEGNKYYIQDEDGEWILDYDAAIDYLSQFKKRNIEIATVEVQDDTSMSFN